MVDADDDWDCPLCMEEMDAADRLFHPCPCGYQICRFCWHKISQDMNKLCPACRREYCDEYIQQQNQPVQQRRSSQTGKIQQTCNPFSNLMPPSSPTSHCSAVQPSASAPVSTKETRDRDSLVNARRHLTNLRVIQKNLVYVIGLSPRIAHEQTLMLPEYFGQYGKIVKIVVNKRNYVGVNSGHLPSASVYVTYSKREEAARAIKLIDETVFDGRTLRASYGTTKYCTFFLRGIVCQNPGCMYLHEQGEEQDSFTKEQMAEGFHLDRFLPKEKDLDEGQAPRQAFTSPPTACANDATQSNEQPNQAIDESPFRVPSLSDVLVVLQNSPRTISSPLQPAHCNDRSALIHSITPPPPTSATFFSFNPFNSTSTHEDSHSPSSPPSTTDTSHFLSKTAPRLASQSLWSGHDHGSGGEQLTSPFHYVPSTHSSQGNLSGRNPKIPKTSESHFLSPTLLEALRLAVFVPEQESCQSLSKRKATSKQARSPTVSTAQLQHLFGASFNEPWDRTDNSVGFRYRINNDAVSPNVNGTMLDAGHKQAAGSFTSFLQSFAPELLVELLDKVDLDSLLRYNSNSARFNSLESVFLDGLDSMLTGSSVRA